MAKFQILTTEYIQNLQTEHTEISGNLLQQQSGQFLVAAIEYGFQVSESR